VANVRDWREGRGAWPAIQLLSTAVLTQQPIPAATSATVKVAAHSSPRAVPPSEARICKDQGYREHCWGRSVVRVITVVRVARVLLIIVLALLAIPLVMGVGTTSTGPVEKVVLLLLIGGCVYAAAKVTAASEWLVHRLARR
jgi:hypothetical protein